MIFPQADSLVYDWASSEIPDVQWAFAEQNSMPFDLNTYPNGIGIIKLISIKNNGRGFVESTYNSNDDKFDLEYDSDKELMYSINLYGNNAFLKAEQLRNSVYFPNVNDLFVKNQLGFVMTSEHRNLTDMISAQWEPRSQFDIIFYYNVNYNKQIDRIAEVNVKGNIDDGKIETDQKFIL